MTKMKDDKTTEVQTVLDECTNGQTESGNQRA